MNYFNRENYVYLRAIWYRHIRRFAIGDKVRGRLTKNTANFLEQVGMPTNSAELHNKANFGVFDEQFNLFTYDNQQHVILGYIGLYPENMRLPIVVNSRNDVISVVYEDIDNVHKSANLKIQFVNSSIQQYFASLVAYARIVPSLRTLVKDYRQNYKQLSLDDDEDMAFADAIQHEIDIIFDNLKARLQKIDDKTFQTRDYWTEATLFVL